MIILTDLSEVLIHGFYGIEEILTKRWQSEELGERFLRRHSEINDVFCNVMRGIYTENYYWCKFCESFDLTVSFRELKDAFSENLSRKIPGTLDVYKRIIGSPKRLECGAPVVYGETDIRIVSDHVRERIPEVMRLHPAVFALAKKCHWSFEYRALKGDVGFFKRMLDRDGLDPKEVIFVDDMQCNVAAAEKAGIKAVQFENANQLERALFECGFEFY